MVNLPGTVINAPLAVSCRLPSVVMVLISSLFLVVVAACSPGSTVGSANDGNADSMVYTAPGFDQLSRAIDADTIQVSITVTLLDGSGTVEVLSATRIGTTDKWQSEPLVVKAGVPFSIEVIWSAIGVDGVRVNYARQFSTLNNGVNIDDTMVDLSTAPFTFDEFNDDGGAANNFEELVAGTPPTGPPDPGSDTTPNVQATLEAVRDKTFRISWQPVNIDAAFFRVMEDPDGVSGYVDVSGNLDSAARSFDHKVALYARVNSRYIVQACSSESDCIDSAEIRPVGTLVDAIGYVKASNTDAEDGFGLAVSLSADGNTMAIRAAGEDSSGTGINSNTQSDNSSTDSGAVYVFTRSGTQWQQQAYLKASNADPGDQFGHTLNLSADGNTLAVSARMEDSGTGGVNANPDDNSVNNSGAAYVFTRSGTQWQEQAYLKASNPGATDQFGFTIALSDNGNTLAVGARREDSDAIGVDSGDQSNDLRSNSGAVYVFTRSGSQWQQQSYLKAGNPGADDEFGYRISISGDGSTLAAGAIGEDGIANNAGGVYVFTRSGSTWVQQALLKARNADAGDSFGNVLNLNSNGNTLVVGTRFEAGGGNGVNNALENDNSAPMSGAAYLFQRSNNVWQQEAYLKASNAQANDEFGVRVSLSGDGNRLAVSARFEASAEAGVQGDQTDNALFKSGAVYVFDRSNGEWRQLAYLKSISPDAEDEFGARVELSDDGETLAVGVGLEDGSSTGLDGNPADNGAGSAGAVYIY